MSDNPLVDQYTSYTAKLSDLTRQLSFAGIAVIWLFRITNGESQVIPKSLEKTAVLLVAALTIDLLQYLIGSIWMIIVLRRREAQGKFDHIDDSSYKFPPTLSWTTFYMVIAKSLLVCTAFISLLEFLAKNILAK